MLPQAKILILLLSFFFAKTIASANTFTVTTNADSGPGSLREAIANAGTNGPVTADLIVFNIPYVNEASITIQLLTMLPDITANLTIDGTTQPSAVLGVSNSKIIIQPQGGNNSIMQLDACLTLPDADNVQIYGLCIKYFHDFVKDANVHQPVAVSLHNANNFVFGAPGKGNVIAGSCWCISKNYSMGTVNNCIIQSNFFGLDADGKTQLRYAPLDNNLGGVILTLGNNAKIGGSNPLEGNVFSGITVGVGFIEMTGSIEIGNNKFGTDYTGSTDIFYNSCMGGRDSPADFFIYDNIATGESDFNAMSGRFLVVRNFFGTNALSTPFSYSILDFNNCTGKAMIGGNDASTMNVFANGLLGVGNNNSTSISVLHNSFYCHDEDGIYMNWYTLPNKPFITINKITATSVEGTSKPKAIIELYQTDTCRHCEGKVYITRFNADALGNWKYNGIVSTTITATATNFDDSTTSAFAQPTIDETNAVVTNATCNKANGKITGVKIISGTSFSWTDINGAVVGTDTSLINVPAGNYQLTVSIGSNTCKKISQVFTVGNSVPPAITIGFSATNPTCGAFNGEILYTLSFFPDSAVWLNAAGNIIQRGAEMVNAGPGNYFFRIVIPGDTSCYSSYGPIQLVNQSGPSVDITTATINAATCNLANGSITNIGFSNITGTAIYNWLDSLNRLVSSTPDLLNVPAGIYRLKFKDQGGCDTIITSAITIGNAGNIMFDTSTKVIIPSKCVASTGSIQNITVTNGNTYKWIDITTGSIVSVNKDLMNVAPGYYKLIATSNAGCTDSMKVFYVPQATPRIPNVIGIGSNPETCGRKNGSAIVTTDGTPATGFSFQWSDSSTSQVISNSLSIQNLASGNYACYSIDSNGCSRLAGVAGITNLAPAINNTPVITPDVCMAQEGSITKINVESSVPLTYSWYNNATVVVSTGKDLVNVGQGNYYLIVKDANNCERTSDHFFVDNTTMTPATPIYDPLPVLKGSPANLVVKNPANGSYELYATASSASPVLVNTNGKFVTGPLSNDTIVYVLLRKGDCISSRTPVLIKVAETLELNMPNAFTPNSDGHNDLFRIKYPSFISTIQMNIFNRFGEKVFESRDAAKAWDGTFNGKQQPIGNYIWTISYIDILGRNKKASGHVLLIR